MSQINDSDRTAHRSMRSVRRSKTPTDPREPGVKRERQPLHKRLLVRFRAEYKIRKIRRFVRKAVEFVPSKVLGWLKAVRACFNRKFRKGAPEEPVDTGGLVLLSDSDMEVSYGVPIPVPHEPFPHWWDWHFEKEDGSLCLYRGREVLYDRVASRRLDDLGNWVSEMTLLPDGIRWEKPEALGGDHLLTVLRTVDEGEPPKRFKRVFTWDLGGPFYSGTSTQQLRDYNAQFDLTRPVTPRFRGIPAPLVPTPPPDFASFAQRLAQGLATLDEIEAFEGGATYGHAGAEETEAAFSHSWLEF